MQIVKKQELQKWKLFKILIAMFSMLVIVIVAFGAIFVLDLAASGATTSEILTPNETWTGKL